MFGGHNRKCSEVIPGSALRWQAGGSYGMPGIESGLSPGSICAKQTPFRYDIAARVLLFYFSNQSPIFSTVSSLFLTVLSFRHLTALIRSLPHPSLHFQLGFGTNSSSRNAVMQKLLSRVREMGALAWQGARPNVVSREERTTSSTG